MITVKFYGILRIDSGLKELELETDSIRALFAEISRLYPSVSPKALRNSIVLVNGSRVGLTGRLKEGDIVQFLSPSAGG